MHRLLYIIPAIIVIVIIAFFVLGFMSKKGQALGLNNGHLQACESTDNCVISESLDGNVATVEAFTYTESEAEFLVKLSNVIEAAGGKVIATDDNYIATTFTSGIFGFVDDVEFRLSDNKQLHFRSASRVGRKDFGANKKRIDELKILLSK